MGLRRQLFKWFARHPDASGPALVMPGVAFLILFFGLPLVAVLATSFMHRGTYGGVEWGFTLENYARLGEGLYLAILGRSALYALVSTLGCLLLGYPVAWLIASSGKYKSVLAFLVILPSWTSFLVRTFALIFIFRDTGLLNTLLAMVGLGPVEILYTPTAVVVGMVYAFLPFMILPIYASLEKLDPALLEAAAVLGARPWSAFWRVAFPLSLPGVAAGALLVFIPALGTYLVSDLLGGAKQMLVGNLVQNQFSTARNWPFGAAISFALTALVVIGGAWYTRLSEEER